ncbi:MAG TPA: hypothetical protein VMG59_08075 [Phycisphaerae bacterium]|nr:hypothetical protein [Phycisphaerae bacterium]
MKPFEERDPVYQYGFIIYVVVNFLAMLWCFYWLLSSDNEARMIGEDGLDFGLIVRNGCLVLPVYLICILINFIWGIKALFDLLGHRGYHAALGWLVVAVAWVCDLILIYAAAHWPTPV